MRKNIVEPDGPQLTIIRRMRNARWITKATNTHSEYVIPIAFPLQHWLYERASVLRYTMRRKFGDPQSSSGGFEEQRNNRMIQEERLVFWEVIVSVVVIKKSSYEHVSNSEWFPR